MSINSRMVTVLHLCSVLVLLYSLSIPVPMLVGLLFGETVYFPYLFTLGISFVAGGLGWLLTRGRIQNLQPRDSFLVAVLFWLIFSAISSLPLYLDPRLDLEVVDAVFEGISGITTTGASVLEDIDHLPRSVLFYRAQLNFLGGLGIIVLALAVMPFLGIGGAKLYQSEMPGPMREDRLTPRLADTARHLWVIYTGLAAACCWSFLLAGMDWFDALCHSLSTVSLGGFSTHGNSLGYYDSPEIEVVGGVFSFLAAVNSALYFLAINRSSITPILSNTEFRFFSLVFSVVVAITCLELYRTDTFSAQNAVIHGFFQAASVMTDNGLAAGNYPSWPDHIVVLLLGASFFGGCVGSTCGGIKAMRFVLLHRLATREIRQLIHPSAVIPVKVGGRLVSERMIRSVWGLFFLYIFFTCVFVWGLMALGHDLVTAFGTVAACINNMGIGHGTTASTFAGLGDEGKWLMCTAMLFGRLEIFPLLIVMSRTFWRY